MKFLPPSNLLNQISYLYFQAAQIYQKLFQLSNLSNVFNSSKNEVIYNLPIDKNYSPIYTPKLPIGIYGVPKENLYATRLSKNGRLMWLPWFIE